MNTKKITNNGQVYELPTKEEKDDKKQKGKKKVSKSGEVYEEPVKKPVAEEATEEEDVTQSNTPSEPSEEYKRGFQAALDMVKQQQAQQPA